MVDLYLLVGCSIGFGFTLGYFVARVRYYGSKK